MTVPRHRKTRITDGSARPGHVLFVVTDYLPCTGGTTSQTREQAANLLARGWRVSVLTRRQSRQHPPAETIDGVEVRRVGRPGYSVASKALDLALCWWYLVWKYRRDVDVVQAVMDADYAVAGCLAGLTRRTCLMWATDGDPERFLSGRFGKIRRWLLRRCSHVTLTEEMRAELLGYGGEFASAVIPVPVDVNRFRPPDVSRAARESENLEILFVGHLIARKAPELLLEAFRDFHARWPKSRLTYVGAGAGQLDSVEDKLRRYVAAESLSGTVEFTGAIDNVIDYLQAADIFVLPSWREGMPNSILEAMACELACVAPASAGGTHLLSDGAGLIPWSNSPADLLAGLEFLAAKPEARIEMGGAARQRVAVQNSPGRVVDAYVRVWATMRGQDSDQTGADASEPGPLAGLGDRAAG